MKENTLGKDNEKFDHHRNYSKEEENSLYY